jgi:hypothetical protein
MHRGLMQAQSRPCIPDKRMSEYQYYEFQTADRRLSEKDMQELITPTSFSNKYSFLRRVMQKGE